MQRITDKEKLVRLAMLYAESLKPWDLPVFYDMILNFPEEILYQWTARYGYRQVNNNDQFEVNVPETEGGGSWKMNVTITTIGGLAHELFAYWYEQPSKELFTPAREWVDHWRRLVPDEEHRKFYASMKQNPV